MTARGNIEEVKLLILKGHHGEALEQIKKLEQTSHSANDRVLYQLVKSVIFNKLGEIEKGLKLADEVFKVCLDSEKLLHATDAIIVKVEVTWRLGKLDEGLKLIKEGEKLLEETQVREIDQLTERKGSLMRHEGIIHLYKGNLTRANESLERALEIFEGLNDSENIAATLGNLGNVHHNMGNLDKAQKYHQQSLTIREKIGNKQAIAASLNNIGNALRDKGNLNSALDYYLKSLSILREIGNAFMTSYLLNNTGVLFHDKGDLNKALEYLKESLVLREEIGNEQIIARTLNNLGSAYRDMENYETALSMHRRALRINESIGNNIETAETLFDLANVSLDKQDFDLARKYHKQLQGISDREDHWVIRQRSNIVEALLLREEKRIRKRFKATEILEEVIEEGISREAYHELTVIAMINLCDLLLYEVKVLGEEGVMGEIQELSGKIHDIAKKQASHSLLVESYLLKSKLALLELDTDQAQELLVQARLLAIERGLDRLARTIAGEEEVLLSNLSKWKEISTRKPRMQEIIDLTRIDDLINRMIHKKVQRDEEEMRDYAMAVSKLWTQMEEK
ncbi:MAG: tetratricopeptide repeat protein [Candidatus Hodarchaeales archaeon]